MYSNINNCRCCGSYNIMISDMGIYEPFFCYRVPSITKDQDYYRYKKFIIDGVIQIQQDTTSINICSDCDFISPKRCFSREELDGLYSGYRNSIYNLERNCFEPGYLNTAMMLESEEFISKRLSDCWNFLKNHMQNKKFNYVCDFGGADGKLIPKELLEISNHIIINDISGVGVVNEKFIKQNEIEENSLDLALCMHVLEHVGNPAEYFDYMISKIKKGGYLYVELPLEVNDEFLFNVRNKNIFVRMHEHINKFSENSLKKISVKNYTSIIEYGKFSGNIAIIVKKEE